MAVDNSTTSKPPDPPKPPPPAETRVQDRADRRSLQPTPDVQRDLDTAKARKAERQEASGDAQARTPDHVEPDASFQQKLDDFRARKQAGQASGELVDFSTPSVAQNQASAADRKAPTEPDAGTRPKGPADPEDAPDMAPQKPNDDNRRDSPQETTPNRDELGRTGRPEVRPEGAVEGTPANAQPADGDGSTAAKDPAPRPPVAKHTPTGIETTPERAAEARDERMESRPEARPYTEDTASSVDATAPKDATSTGTSAASEASGDGGSGPDDGGNRVGNGGDGAGDGGNGAGKHSDSGDDGDRPPPDDPRNGADAVPDSPAADPPQRREQQPDNRTSMMEKAGRILGAVLFTATSMGAGSMIEQRLQERGRTSEPDHHIVVGADRTTTGPRDPGPPTDLDNAGAPAEIRPAPPDELPGDQDGLGSDFDDAWNDLAEELVQRRREQDELDDARDDAPGDAIPALDLGDDPSTGPGEDPVRGDSGRG